MTDHLLQTKLYQPPKRPELIARPQLITRLNQGLPRKLTLISAPAGFGKTTLISEWLQNRPTAWLSLDNDDNDPGRFLTYVAAALQRHDAQLGATALSLLHAQPQIDLTQVVTTLLNGLVAWSKPLSLVLDDYHLIDNPAIHEQMTFLLEHLPPAVHLVILSRSDPPFSIARWRVQGQVTELRAADLRFTPAETARFFNDLMQLNLTTTDIAVLEARTEGWVASLQLAALSLRQQSAVDRARFIQHFTGSHRYLMDYLVDEILQQQSAERKHFLLHTAVLNRLCAPLCDAVLAIDEPQSALEPSSVSLLQSQEMLDQLESANLFLIPLNEEHTWFRYHHLFADFLQHRLRQSEPAILPKLHDRASRWFAQNGFLDEAIYHALQASSFERAADLMAEHIESMVVHGNSSQVLRWLNQLPADRRATDPRLSIYHAWALLFLGRLSEVAEVLWRIPALHETPDWPLSTYVLILRGFLAKRQGRFQEGIDCSEEALIQLARLPVPTTTSHIMNGAAAINLADCYRYTNQLEEAYDLYQEALRLNQESGNILAAVGAAVALAQIAAARGHWHQAATIYEEGLQMARSWESALPGPGRKLLAAAPLYAGLGQLFCQWDKLAEAAPLIEEAVALYTLSGTTNEVGGQAALLSLRWAQGELTALLDSLQMLRQLAQQTPEAYTRQQIDALLVEWQARLLAAKASDGPEAGGATFSRQQLTAAIETWVQRCGWHEDDPLQYRTEFTNITLARACSALGQPQKALSLIDRLQALADSTGRTGDRCAYQLLEVVVRQQLGETALALNLLQEVMTHTEPESMIRLYTDEGQPIAALLQQLPPTPYRDRLLAAFNHPASQSPASQSPAPNPQSTLIEPLSARELEVLELLVTGATNQQIADNLIVSHATAKKHVSNIMGKLGVQNRVTAVARARELGLTA